eukprot:scaffold71506_cov48-Phaeocystis_antarctica.AAC.1
MIVGTTLPPPPLIVGGGTAAVFARRSGHRRRSSRGGSGGSGGHSGRGVGVVPLPHLPDRLPRRLRVAAVIELATAGHGCSADLVRLDVGQLGDSCEQSVVLLAQPLQLRWSPCSRLARVRRDGWQLREVDARARARWQAVARPRLARPGRAPPGIGGRRTTALGSHWLAG